MITRIRIDAHGSTAGEVEDHLNWAADRIAEILGELVGSADGSDVEPVLTRGEQHIERNVAEADGCFCAHSGRLIVHPNVADDAPQVSRLTAAAGGCSTVTKRRDGEPTRWAVENGITGGTPYLDAVTD